MSGDCANFNIKEIMCLLQMKRVSQSYAINNKIFLYISYNSCSKTQERGVEIVVVKPIEMRERKVPQSKCNEIIWRKLNLSRKAQMENFPRVN